MTMATQRIQHGQHSFIATPWPNGRGVSFTFDPADGGGNGPLVVYPTVVHCPSCGARWERVTAAAGQQVVQTHTGYRPCTLDTYRTQAELLTGTELAYSRSCVPLHD